ncbi:rhodanese-like domain-containing protein [Rheinheimera sp.]|uniref:rhodanese-like domain-containing protein n=1 Tax=Rheinheimera sp. TaxID=1869214 RepID=UPI003AF7F223
MKAIICALLLWWAGSALAAEVVWLDVRSVQEFQAGHLDGALNLPHDQIEKITTLIADKTTPVKLYCRSGRRSALALEAMKKLGYTQLENAGGYQQLKAQHQPGLQDKPDGV